MHVIIWFREWPWNWVGNSFSKFRVLDERLSKAFINCSYETIGCIGTNKNVDLKLFVTKFVSEFQLLETGVGSETRATSLLMNSVPEVVSRPIVDAP